MNFDVQRHEKLTLGPGPPPVENRCCWLCVSSAERYLTDFKSPPPSVPLSASELSLTEVRDKVPPLRRADPGLMPLPDTACGLEWSSLVSAAKAYEGTCCV